jgi:uncharacterized membrane protein YqjE
MLEYSIITSNMYICIYVYMYICIYVGILHYWGPAELDGSSRRSRAGRLVWTSGGHAELWCVHDALREKGISKTLLVLLLLLLLVVVLLVLLVVLLVLVVVLVVLLIWNKNRKTRKDCFQNIISITIIISISSSIISITLTMYI